MTLVFRHRSRKWTLEEMDLAKAAYPKPAPAAGVWRLGCPGPTSDPLDSSRAGSTVAMTGGCGGTRIPPVAPPRHTCGRASSALLP
jgi:hypothetical protein